MSRSTVLAILERIHDDLAFRQRLELSPEETLQEYADLTREERRALIRYPSVWLDQQSVKRCPHCGELAVVGVDGVLVRCPNCQPNEEDCFTPWRDGDSSR